MIRALIFDLGNVIVPFDFKRGYARIATLCNCAPDQIPGRIRSTGLVQPFETGRIAPERFVEELSAALGLRTTYAEFCEIFNCIFSPDPLIPESLVAELRSRHRLLILSNTNPIHFSMVRENYPLLRHFHDCVLSYEVGAVKPAGEMYEAAIARSGCTAEECFFTDDILGNVEAARRYGIDAVQFESAEQIESELRRRGVL